MKDNLAIAGIAVAFTILLAALTAFVKSRQDHWPEVTPRVLKSDPEFWHERGVKLRTPGMETVGNELKFRTAADQPYRVVVRFPGRLPNPVPAHVRGVCKNEDGVVIVTVPTP